MYNNRVGHNTLPPGGGGGGGAVRQASNINPMHFNQPGIDSMMNGYSQPQGYRPGGGSIPGGGGNMPGGSAGMAGRSYSGGQGGYHGHPPPGTHPGHMSQQSLSQQKLSQQKEQLKEQERRKRKAMVQQQNASAAKKQEYCADLFEAPIKISEPATPGINADKVLGNFKSFSVSANYGNSSFVGVDYQPATPAPVQPHDDDDEVKPTRKLPAIAGRPPQNNTRLPSNMENPRPANKPRPAPVQHHPAPVPPVPWNNSGAMAPPSMAPPSHRINGGSSSYRPPPQQPLSSGVIAPLGGGGGIGAANSASIASSTRISVPPSSNGLHRLQRPPKLSLAGIKGGAGDDQVDQILGAMLGSDLPTPLAAIVTPQVEKTEDRGVQQHQPRYLGAFPDFLGGAMSLGAGGPMADVPELLSRLSESDSDKDIPAHEDTKSTSTPEPPPPPHQTTANIAATTASSKPPAGVGGGSIVDNLVPPMSETSSSESSSDSEESGQEEGAVSESEEESLARSAAVAVGSGRSPGPAGGKFGSSLLPGGAAAAMEKPNLSEEESDDDQHQTRDYNLAVFINKAHDRTPPTTSSVHSNNTLEPSPRNPTYAPTPSPIQSSFANPSPRVGGGGGSLGGSILSASPRTLSGLGGHLTGASPRTLGSSPRSSFMPGLSSAVLSSAVGRLSPLNATTPHNKEITDHINDIMKIDDIPLHAPLSSDEEPPAVQPPPKLKTKASNKSYRRSTPAEKKSLPPQLPLEQPPVAGNNNRWKYSSRKRKHESSSSSNLVKKHNLDLDSDDSDCSDVAPGPPPTKKKASSERSRGSTGNRVTRAASASPMKTQLNHSSSSGSAGRTPSPRKSGSTGLSSSSPRKSGSGYRSPRKPGSGHSTPSSAGRRTPNSRSKPASQPALTESDDDEIDSPPPSAAQKVKSAGTGNVKKNQALFAMFGKKAKNAKKDGAAGKGKGGKGKGGIDFIVGESDEEERKRGSSLAATTTTTALSSPTATSTITSSTSDHTLSSSSHIPPANIKVEPLDTLPPVPTSPVLEDEHHHGMPTAVGGGIRNSRTGDVVDQDLALSEEDDDLPPPPLHMQQQHHSGVGGSSPLTLVPPNHLPPSSAFRLTLQRPAPPPQLVVARKSNGRPSLVCSIPLNRVSRSFGDPRRSSHSQHKDRRGGELGWTPGSGGGAGEKSCDNNYGDNSDGVGRSSHSERIDGSGRMELPERPASARSSSRERYGSGGGGSSGWRGGSEHRKAQERTISQFAPPDDSDTMTGGSERKRHIIGGDGNSSPGYAAGGSREWDKPAAARLHQGATSHSGDIDDYSNHANAAVGGGGSGGLPLQHSTSYGGGAGGDGLMPPPRHYINDNSTRRMDAVLPPAAVPPVEESDIQSGMNEACNLKREADNEENVEAKCTKYLKAFLMFCHSAMRTEKEGDPHNAFNIYNQTLRMIKCVLKPIIPKRQAWPPKEPTDIRLLVMSLRAQSLLNLKMYKLNKHHLKDLQKQISEVLVKSDKDDETQQGGEHGGHLSPTPSPAGSEGSNCSKSSGYTSSGEKDGMTLLVPKATLQNQYNIASYLSQCHELWEQAELFLNKGNCEAFFRSLDEECGPLTLHSDLCKLTNYTKRGLDWISQEYSSLQRSPVTQHRNS
jgi:hypothetical protein